MEKPEKPFTMGMMPVSVAANVSATPSSTAPCMDVPIMVRPAPRMMIAHR